MHSKKILILLNLPPLKGCFALKLPSMHKRFTNVRYRFFNPILTLSFFLLIGYQSFAQPNGELLFKGNCASCHRPTTEALTGPGLKGVRERWAGREELIYEWIRNPQKVLNSGDAYVTKLYAEYKSSGLMTAQALSNEEIDAVLQYVADYQPPVAAGPTDGGPTSDQATGGGNSTPWLLLIVTVLLIVIFSTLGVKKTLQRSLDQSKGIEEDKDFTYAKGFKQWIAKNKIITAFVVILLVVGGLRDVWHGLISIGVYEDYKPEQPIWFSHKVHAGQNEINCVYCHNSVEKSKHAGIPTANVCMNCHVAVSKGKITGTEEIAKIYAATGWDPEKRKYTGEEKPIKWVKVHNLPDHVYFNHSQHVVVGKLECAQCHGDMKQETVGRQMTKEDLNAIEENSIKFEKQTLTMGWCIDCHRQAEVQMADNGYYNEWHKRLSKEELKKYLNNDERITVSEIGGIECAKCHY